MCCRLLLQSPLLELTAERVVAVFNQCSLVDRVGLARLCMLLPRLEKIETLWKLVQKKLLDG